MLARRCLAGQSASEKLVSIRVNSWLIFSVLSMSEEFLVLGQKADMSASNLSLVFRPSSLVHRLTSVLCALCG